MGIWIDTADYYGRRPGMKHLAETVEQAEKENVKAKEEEADSKQERERQRDERIEQTGQLTLERHGEEERAIHMISIIGEIEGHDNLSSSKDHQIRTHPSPACGD